VSTAAREGRTPSGRGAGDAAIRDAALLRRVEDDIRGRDAAGRTAIALGRALLLGVFLGGWAFASGRWMDRQFVSDPAGVLRAFAVLLVSGRLWPNLLQTLTEVLAGYAVGAVLGILLAVLLALADTGQRVLRPFLIGFYSIPKIALAPLIIMWFGLGTAPKVILAAAFVFFVVFMNMSAGVYTVNADLVRLARVMGAGRRAILWKITLPSAVPYLLTGLRLAIPEALIGAVIGEFISANRGLGYLVNSAASQFNTAATLAAIVALLLIVVVLDAGVGLGERRLLRWRPGGPVASPVRG
jgi:sulfonate transport system permease protein